MPNVTDLTNTTWIFDSSPEYFPYQIYAAVNFEINNMLFDGIEFRNIENYDYNSIMCYSENGNVEIWHELSGWVDYDEEYRTIHFIDGSDIDYASLIDLVAGNASLAPVNYKTNSSELGAIADAIRAKGGTSASLVYPSGFISAINDLSTSGPSRMYAEFTSSYNIAIKNVNSDHIENFMFAFNTLQYADKDIFPMYSSIKSSAFFGTHFLSTIFTDQSNRIVSFSTALEYVGDSAFFGAIFGENTDTSDVTLVFPMSQFSSSRGYSAFASLAGAPLRVSFPNMTLLKGQDLFAYARKLYNVSAPVLSEIYGHGMFYVTGLSELYLPSLTGIFGDTQFYYCSSLSVVSLPLLASISGQSHFANCYALNEVSCPKLSLISGETTFNNCQVLSNINLPSLVSINGGSTFYSCSRLATVNVPALVSIYGNYTFYSCTRLTTASFPELTALSGIGNFYNCTSLTTVSFPVLTSINGASNFASTALTKIDLSVWSYTSVTSYMFQNCRSMSVFSAAILSKISGSYMFRSCYNLISIILLGSSVCTLGNTVSIAFPSTPVSTYSTSAGRFASIFVPSSLVSSYKAATNWTTISSKIVAYEDYFDSNGNPR